MNRNHPAIKSIFSMMILLLLCGCVLAAAGHAEGVWSGASRLSGFPSNSWVPDMVHSPDGLVHVVWYDSRDGESEIYHMEWDGAAWTDEERLTFSTGESARPQVATDPWSRVHVVWHDKRDGDFEIYYKMRDGIDWTADQRITFDPEYQGYPSVAADPSGQVHIVWSDARVPGYSDIYYRRGDGLAWEPELRLTESEGFSSKPSIAAGPDGKVHVAWYDSREGVYEVFYKLWDGQEWSEDERVSDSLTMSWYQNMAVDSSGNLHLVWLDKKDGNWEVYYRKRGEYGWEDEVRLSHNDARAGNPEVTVDSGGRVHVVWRDFRDENLEVYYTGFHANEDRWTNETRLTFSPEPSRRPSVCVDADGRIIVAFMEDREEDTGLFCIKGRLPELTADGERDILTPFDSLLCR